MLKIEVIKFEAQDVITASVAAVYTPAEPECICNSDVSHSDCVSAGTHSACTGAGYEGDHNCYSEVC